MDPIATCVVAIVPPNVSCLEEHETRLATEDLSDEGIDDTFVLLRGDRYQSLMDDSVRSEHPSQRTACLGDASVGRS